jgi:transposase
VELFEQIRLDRERGMSKRALAAKHGVHRRTVRQALADALPPPRKRPERRAPRLGPYHALIDGWLIADQTAPRKQRHTAKRIWQRLRAEHSVDVGETTVREYVRRRRRELAPPRQAFVPQVHLPGAEAEVDWFEAYVDLGGKRTKVNIFVMRSSYSAAAFAVAFLHQTQQAFLEGHVAAFEFFNGVFKRLRYDNLTSAVKQVLRGRKRVESDRFVQLRSHYLYESFFTLVGLEGAHEKGGVEGEGGRFRRTHLVPVPQAADLAEFNRQLRGACIADLERTIVGREHTVGAMHEIEQPKLRTLPEYAFITDEILDARVSAKSLVTVKQNAYSVPVSLVGSTVVVRVGARRISISKDHQVVAQHPRLAGRFGCHAQLDHYLDLLTRKPGALEGSVALAQERDRGTWPGVLDELWSGIAELYGPSDAARQMVDVLLLAREHGPTAMATAAAGALAAGAYDGRAVAVLARRASKPRPEPLRDLAPHLTIVGTPEPALAHYNQLLTRTPTP